MLHASRLLLQQVENRYEVVITTAKVLLAFTAAAFCLGFQTDSHPLAAAEPATAIRKAAVGVVPFFI